MLILYLKVNNYSQAFDQILKGFDGESNFLYTMSSEQTRLAFDAAPKFFEISSDVEYEILIQLFEQDNYEKQLGTSFFLFFAIKLFF